MRRTDSNKRKNSGRANDRGRKQRRGESQTRPFEDPSASLERPPPPPAPPRALVKLLQTNAAALKYFQALQNNLDFDVRKWKTRARAHEKTCRDLQAQIDQLQSPSQSAIKKARRPNSGESSPAVEQLSFVDSSYQYFEKNGDDGTKGDEEKTGRNNRNTNGYLSASKENGLERRELKDEDFDAMFSSDDDDDKEEEERGKDNIGKEVQETNPIASLKSTASSFGIFQRPDSSNLDLSSSSDEEGDTYFAFGSKAPSNTTLPNGREKEASCSSLPSTPIGNHYSKSASTELAMNQLKIAVQNLERLGIHLVDQVVLTAEEDVSSNTNGTDDRVAVEALESSLLSSNEETNSICAGSNDDCDNNHHASSICLRRRPDQQVIIDVLQAIRAVTRIKAKKPKATTAGNEDITNECDENPGSSDQRTHSFYYYPFMTTNLLPCYTALPVFHKEASEVSSPPHPAVWTVEAIVQSLCIMDVFSPILDELVDNNETDIVGDNNQSIDNRQERSNENDLVQIGMKGRKKLVSQLVQSLEGEIVDSWGFQDRATRLATLSCHLTPSMDPMVLSDTEQAYEKERKNNGDENSDDDREKYLSQEQKYFKNHKSNTNADGTFSFNSKNFVRLSAIAERCILGKIIAGIYLFRQDYQRVFRLFWGYLLSTAPSMSLENHPRLPPVQSIAVLEAILCTRAPRLSNSEANSEASNAFEVVTEQNDNGTDSTLLAWIGRTAITTKLAWTLKFVLESTASIYQARNSYGLMDDRITDVSRLELAAYGRLQKAFQSIFDRLLGKNLERESMRNHIMKETKEMLQQEGKCSSDERKYGNQQPMWAVTALSLLVQGDVKTIDNLYERSLSTLKKSPLIGRVENSDVVDLHGVISACAVAKRHLEIRQVDEYQRVVNTPMIFTPHKTGNICIQDYTKNYTDWLIETQSVDTTPSDIFISGLQLCQETADGESIMKLVQWITQNLLEKEFDQSMYPVLDFMETQARSLTVRVINLKRRPDRMAAFTAHALNEHMTYIKAVTDLTLEAEKGLATGQIEENLCYGMFAIDGQGKAAEVEERLTELVGGRHEILAGLVETHWVPNDLKPFDSDAPDYTKKVLISASEKACALSHISAWKGVVHSLSMTFNTNFLSTPAFRNLESIRRKYLVSGFARGPPLFPSNNGMEPTEVCVILEDDAVLVDRFTDRLSSLLEDLPRDFHFCSIGYSRPKTAPLVPFSSQLGIPTALWYMTGYIISLEGARYLLKKLPIRGPVDSWIGLAMFSNWDNIFGHKMGVGVSSKALNESTISREDLRRILRFRAFAASVPLCSQRVGNPSGLPARGRSWRQRDTDIAYSGNCI